MERKKTDGMPDYQNGKVYRITSVIGGVEYYGSTTCALSKRIGEHRSAYKRFLDGKGGQFTSFQVLAFEDAAIVLVELFPCNSKEELHARERFWIESEECVNKVVPGRSHREYCVDNKEKIAEYYINNKEKILEKANEKFTCQCGGRFTKCHESHHLKSLKHRRYLESLPPPEYTA